MRWFALSLLACSTMMVGCEQPKEDISDLPAVSIPSPSVESASSAVTVESEAPPAGDPAAAPPEATAPAATTEPVPTEAPAAGAVPKEGSTSSKPTDAGRFVATTSVKVPTMMCPFSCWPKVKETLAAQPGVEGVQLAAQAKEGEIDNPVVELKTTEKFDAASAVAALEKASFADAAVLK